MREYVEKDSASLEETVKNIRGIIASLDKGTRKFKGEEKPLTRDQIRRRLKKMEEQNNVLEESDIPKFRYTMSGQD